MGKTRGSRALGSQLAIIALTLATSSSALAFEPEATCEGWTATRFWGGAAQADGEAILEQLIDEEWVAVAGSVDSQTIDAAGDLTLSGVWDTQLDGTFRVNLSVLVYDASLPDIEPFAFDAISEELDCEPPSDANRHGPFWWRHHPEAWPVDELEISGNTYSQECLRNAIARPAWGDIRVRLLRQLIAAELNLRSGTDADAHTRYPLQHSNITDTVAAAHALLEGSSVRCDSGRIRGRRPRGRVRALMTRAWSALRRYNHECTRRRCGWWHLPWHPRR